MTTRPGLAALLALALLPPAASAAEWDVTGRSKQGPVSFHVSNPNEPENDRLPWTTDFRFRTRCGTITVPGPLYWWESRSVFSYRSKDGRTALWIYIFTGPDGGGYGWARTERKGCASGHLKITLDED